jgi:hypothetical protein
MVSSSVSSSSPSPSGRKSVQPSITKFFKSPVASIAKLTPRVRQAQDKNVISALSSVVKDPVFPPLEIVWAKFPSYPPWPAMVCPDPMTQQHVDRERGEVHVQFFDEPVSHAWVEAAAVEKMAREDAEERLGARKKGGRWFKEMCRATKEALLAMGMTAAKRKEMIVHFNEDGTKEGDKAAAEEEDEENVRPKKAKRRKKQAKAKKEEDNVVGKENENCGGDDGDLEAEDPEEMGEYDKIRLRNIEQRRKLFDELDITGTKNRLSASFSNTPKSYTPSGRGLASKDKQVARESLEPSRKSLRIQKIDADTGLKLPEKEPTLYWSPPDEHPVLPLRTLALSEVAKEEGDDFVKGEAEFLEGLSKMKVSGKENASFGEDIAKSLKSLTINVRSISNAKLISVF